MIAIGEYELLHTARFLLPVDEEALIEFAVDDETANFRVRFINGDKKIAENKKAIHAQPDPDAEDQGLITFHNWNRSGRDSSGDPMNVLTIGDLEIQLIAVVDGFTDTWALDLQFMAMRRDHG